MDENEHPRGALLFMLVYLLLLVVMWTQMYLRLWRS
jgi:predicted nucleic acid-binding Zn ribbon protein